MFLYNQAIMVNYVLFLSSAEFAKVFTEYFEKFISFFWPIFQPFQ